MLNRFLAFLVALNQYGAPAASGGLPDCIALSRRPAI